MDVQNSAPKIRKNINLFVVMPFVADGICAMLSGYTSHYRDREEDETFSEIVSPAQIVPYLFEPKRQKGNRTEDAPVVNNYDDDRTGNTNCNRKVLAILFLVVVILLFLCHLRVPWPANLIIAWRDTAPRRNSLKSELQGGTVVENPLLETSQVLNYYAPDNGINKGNFANDTALRTPFQMPRQEVPHLFFLKVHKAASTTVFNVVYRFALHRGLKILLPRREMGNILSEHSKEWIPNALLPPNGIDNFDILCNHIVFDEQSIRSYLPKDTVFVGIVRHPFDQFVSAFWYYREKYNMTYLANIPGNYPISTYLEDPKLWEPKPELLSLTSNRMSIDFGMDFRQLSNTTYIENYIQYLNRTFHLVMVCEKFDESILLMRHLLGWELQDVLYIRNNARKNYFYNQSFTNREMQSHEKFNLADYALYEHFAKVLDKKIRDQGDIFAQEVISFRRICKTVEEFCQSEAGDGPLKVQATNWNEDFSVTREDCFLMTIDEMMFVELVRNVTTLQTT